MFSGFESFLYILVMSVMRCGYIDGVAIVQKLFICLCGYRNVVGFAESAALFMVDAVVGRYGHTCDEI